MSKQVEPGDRVYDELNEEWRTVARIGNDGDVFMEDGGVMGLHECREIILPSERMPDSEMYQVTIVKWKGRHRSPYETVAAVAISKEHAARKVNRHFSGTGYRVERDARINAIDPYDVRFVDHVIN